MTITRGRWYYDDDTATIESELGVTIAGIDVDNVDYEANARLITAAPQMAYALRLAELHLSISDRSCADGGNCGECLRCSATMAFNAVRAAIAEAGVLSI